MAKYYRKDVDGPKFKRFVQSKASKGDFFDDSTLVMFLESCYLQFFNLGDEEFGYEDDDWDEAINDIEILLENKPDFIMENVVIPGWKLIKKDKKNVSILNNACQDLEF